MPYLTVMAHFHWIHDLLTSNPLMTWLDLQPMKHVMNTTMRAVQEHESHTDARNDMIEYWKSQKHSEPLIERELLATANRNVAAGADTVGSELQAFVYLLRNPECLSRLHDELDAASLNNEISSPVQYNTARKLYYF